MAKKRNAPVLRNNLRNEPAEKFRTVNRMNGIVTMVEYTSEDDIKAYELEPTFRELTGGGSGDLSISEVTLISSDGLNYSTYVVMTQTDNFDYITGVAINEETGFSYNSLDLLVNGEPQTVNVVIMPNKYIYAACPPGVAINDYIVTGNAEVETVSVEGTTMKIVKIYGTCSITLVP